MERIGETNQFNNQFELIDIRNSYSKKKSAKQKTKRRHKSERKHRQMNKIE